MATYKGPIAGPRLLAKSIERTRANQRMVRESRHEHGRIRALPSSNRYIEQRLHSFSYQSEEGDILATLEKLKNGLR
jgi:hypothetical protein